MKNVSIALIAFIAYSHAFGAEIKLSPGLSLDLTANEPTTVTCLATDKDLPKCEIEWIGSHGFIQMNGKKVSPYYTGEEGEKLLVFLRGLISLGACKVDDK